MDENWLKSTSHKGEKVRGYLTDFKLEVFLFAEANSIHAASKNTKLIETVSETGRKNRRI